MAYRETGTISTRKMDYDGKAEARGLTEICGLRDLAKRDQEVTCT